MITHLSRLPLKRLQKNPPAVSGVDKLANVSDARAYWSDLPDKERNAVLVGLADNYWDVPAYRLSELAPTVSGVNSRTITKVTKH
jgi:hypothetical protein